MKNVLFAVLVLGFSVSASAFTSSFDVLSFNCFTTSGFGVSQFEYIQNRDRTVQVTRNTEKAIEYSLHSSGVIGSGMQIYGSHHLTFSGGRLKGNQYMTFAFSGDLQPGMNKISGSVLVVTQGGSPFAPTLGSVYSLGSFICESFELR